MSEENKDLENVRSHIRDMIEYKETLKVCQIPGHKAHTILRLDNYLTSVKTQLEAYEAEVIEKLKSEKGE
jgi:hypothetical protein